MILANPFLPQAMAEPVTPFEGLKAREAEMTARQNLPGQEKGFQSFARQQQNPAPQTVQVTPLAPSMAQAGGKEPTDPEAAILAALAQSKQDGATPIEQGEATVPSASPVPAVSGQTEGTPPAPTAGSNEEAQIQAALSQSREDGKPDRGFGMNILAGVNDRISQLGHAAYWYATNRIKPGDMQDFIKNEQGRTEDKRKFQSWLQDHGMAIATDDDKSMGAKIGRNQVDAMLTLGTFFAAAPLLASAEGMSTSSLVLRTLGEGLQKHPWLQTMAEVVGGVPGSTVGEEHFGPAGALLGGVTGNVLTMPLQAGVRGTIGLTKGLVTKLADAVDTIAAKAGASNTPIEALGQKPRVPFVNPDHIDTLREAEARTRAVGDTLTSAMDDARVARRTGNLDERVAAERKVWALKRDEQTAADASERAYLQLPKEVRAKYSQESLAIRNDFADTEYARTFSENQLAGDRKLIEDRIKHAFDSTAPRSGENVEAAANRLSTSLQDAEDVADRLVSRAYKKVDILDEKMPSRTKPQGDLDLFMQEMRANVGEDSIPYDQVKSLRTIFATKGESTLFQENPSVAKVRGTIRDLDVARRQALGDPRGPNNVLASNISRLQAMADDWIMQAFPDNIALKQARALSQLKHDLFTRSELAPLLEKNARGALKVRPGETLDKILGSQRAVDDIYAVTDRLLKVKRFPDQKDAYSGALEGKDQMKLKQLQMDMEDGIRSEWQSKLSETEQDPLKAQRALDKMLPKIKAFSKVASQLEGSVNEAMAAVADRKAIDNASVAKYFETNDPTKAMDKIWSAKDPAATARAIITGEAGIGGFAKDARALEGFRALATDKLLKMVSTTAGPDPSRLAAALRDPKINKLMTTILGSDRMSRLEHISSSIVQLDKSPERNNTIYYMTKGAQLLALKAHALLPSFGKGGQLQQAAMFSEIAKRRVTQMFAAGRGDPVTLLGEAIRDPSVERMLFTRNGYSTDYADVKNIATQTALVRRVLRMDVGLRTAFAGALKGDGPGPRQSPPTYDELKQLQGPQE